MDVDRQESRSSRPFGRLQEVGSHVFEGIPKACTLFGCDVGRRVVGKCRRRRDRDREDVGFGRHPASRGRAIHCISSAASGLWGLRFYP